MIIIYAREKEMGIPAEWCCMLSTTEDHVGIDQKEPAYLTKKIHSDQQSEQL